MAFDYTNLYPDTSGNGGYTKSWNYTTVGDSIAVCSASGYFNKVATRVGIGDNIVVAVVDAFDKSRTALVESATLFVTGISGGVVTTTIFTTPIPVSPAFTGIPTAPTAAPGTNSSQIATTAYADAIAALKANLASPTFTGTPASPTAAPGTNTTQLATTAYADAIAALKANIASPALTGTPTAPTAAVDTSTTQLATTAMVLGQAGAATPGAVTNTAVVGTSTRYARADHVHAFENTAWTVYTPAITSGGGTPTTVTATGRYKQIGKTVFVQAKVTITAIGTATGNVKITLPFTAAAFDFSGSVFESGISGKSGSGYVQASTNLILATDATGATWWVNGYALAVTQTYEVP